MTTKIRSKVFGYLPNDIPPIGQIVLLGFQHALTMFPATVLVALMVGFHTSTVLFASGMATIVALLGSRYGIGKFIPLYYGSSFSYLAAITAITGASYGVVADDAFIRVAQAGIVVTGVVNVVAGILIRFAGGKKAIDVILPPVVTGSVALVIGVALGKVALNMTNGLNVPGAMGGDGRYILVALITLLATVLFSVYLQGRGFIGMLPILLGAVVGYLAAIPLGLVDFTRITNASLLISPHITFPDFGSSMSATAIVSIAVMAIATIPESTAHLYQISLYVDHLAEEMNQKAYELNQAIGLNLVLDGIGDMINGLLGGAAGTNYGENNSLMVISKNYSGVSLLAAGLIAILMAFSGHLSGLVASIPEAVSGGLAVYLFGVIGLQGIAMMISEKVNLYDPKQLAIGAVILIIGIGGHIGYPNGFLPIPMLQNIFPYGWPAIATAAVVGILLNLLFLALKPLEKAS